MTARHLVLVLVPLLVAGCSSGVGGQGAAPGAGSTPPAPSALVRVNAPEGVCWTAAAGDVSEEGCGFADFPLTGDVEGTVVTVEKDDPSAAGVVSVDVRQPSAGTATSLGQATTDAGGTATLTISAPAP